MVDTIRIKLVRELRAATEDAELADVHFRDAYRAAFGRRAVDASYELDREAHPVACQQAYRAYRLACDEMHVASRRLMDHDAKRDAAARDWSPAWMASAVVGG